MSHVPGAPYYHGSPEEMEGGDMSWEGERSSLLGFAILVRVIAFETGQRFRSKKFKLLPSQRPWVYPVLPTIRSTSACFGPVRAHPFSFQHLHRSSVSGVPKFQIYTISALDTPPDVAGYSSVFGFQTLHLNQTHAASVRAVPCVP